MLEGGPGGNEHQDPCAGEPVTLISVNIRKSDTGMPTPANFELPVINPKPRKPGTFGRGNPPPSNGRRPGQVNKITADLKQGILRGAANCG